MKKIIITNESGRLDKVLSETGEMARSYAQKMIKSGLVSVNDSPSKSDYHVKEGDSIVIVDAPEETPEQFIEKHVGDLPQFEVVCADKDFLVINKPAGVLTHGAPHLDEPSLADALVAKYQQIKKVGDDPWRPGIVHRLDKEASGLLAVALNNDFFDIIKKQFKARTTEKEYLALVHGCVEQEHGEIDFAIKRSREGNKMAAVPKDSQFDDARPAISEFWVIERFLHFTLLRVKIKTGRTHQIRAHMAAFDHPIVGDNLYGSSRAKLANKKIGLNRIFLTAVKLGFKDLSGAKRLFEIELPDDLKMFLEGLKK